MSMVGNMLLTVAVIAVAAGAVPEFQLRIGNIRPSANGAPEGIGGLGCCSGSLIGTGIEGDGFVFLMGGFIFCPFGCAAGIDLLQF